MANARDEKNKQKERDAADLAKMKKENNELKNGNAKLKSQLYDCQKENDRLRKELENLKRENAKLKKAAGLITTTVAFRLFGLSLFKLDGEVSWSFDEVTLQIRAEWLMDV